MINITAVELFYLDYEVTFRGEKISINYSPELRIKTENELLEVELNLRLCLNTVAPE